MNELRLRRNVHAFAYKCQIIVLLVAVSALGNSSALINNESQHRIWCLGLSLEHSSVLMPFKSRLLYSTLIFFLSSHSAWTSLTPYIFEAVRTKQGSTAANTAIPLASLHFWLTKVFRVSNIYTASCFRTRTKIRAFVTTINNRMSLRTEKMTEHLWKTIRCTDEKRQASVSIFFVCKRQAVAVNKNSTATTRRHLHNALCKTQNKLLRSTTKWCAHTLLHLSYQPPTMA